MKNNLYIITGQTATGKTKRALELAQKYDGELINCDSRQVYKHLDIITGKDIIKSSRFKLTLSKNNFDIGYYSITDLTNFNNSHPTSTRIWLYDIIDPKQYFSSYDFTQCALLVIKDIFRRNKTPIIVGGTYFYLHHLLYDIPSETIPPNWPLRKQLGEKSIEELQKILKKIDTQSFNQLNTSDKNNPRRLIRRVEIAFSSRNLATPSLTPHPSLAKKLGFEKLKIKIIGLRFVNYNRLRETIYQRIEKRLKQGAIKEVKSLLEKKYTENDPGLKTIGYQQLISYLKGKITKKEAIIQWLIKEVHYAKKQYTFMKKYLGAITWIDV